ncbi:stilbene biosynthesis aromatase StlC [Photorhabdus aegyptia]|uniref:stilbene biosynthesis aromatase StlC n=1 Tax=Photorhabdus aegyptia TaxID=2805098 RepID=UPI001E63AC56|nr:stilbene biosynthesis aromatase StlC [Photorhabdus aegyptia]MCC8460169.1 stilbene biosynthesis aromatase StlC [Photorhabdus aegyptia]
MKRVLVVSYSQSGQLIEVVKSLISPLQESDEIYIREVVLKPIPEFAFPWKFSKFVDVFPETVQLHPPELAPLNLEDEEPFDLVILGYQVWYLSPAPPITAFLKSKEGKRVLNGRPVVTVIACRNMWLIAQETVKRLLHESGAYLRDNVVFVDKANFFATVFTTPIWLMTGKRQPFPSLPRAGVSEEDVKDATRFGNALLAALKTDKEKVDAPMLKGMGAAVVDQAFIFGERAAHRGFRFWSGLICRVGKRGIWVRRSLLALFVTYLILMVLVVFPISVVVRRLLAPLLKERLNELQKYYEQPSGSARYDDKEINK